MVVKKDLYFLGRLDDPEHRSQGGMCLSDFAESIAKEIKEIVEIS
jgi:hypothetical protein